MKDESLTKSALDLVSMSTSVVVLVMNLLCALVVVVAVAIASRRIRRQIEDTSAQYEEMMDVLTDIREYKRTQVAVWQKAMESHAHSELEQHLKGFDPTASSTRSEEDPKEPQG